MEGVDEDEVVERRRRLEESSAAASAASRARRKASSSSPSATDMVEKEKRGGDGRTGRDGRRWRLSFGERLGWGKPGPREDETVRAAVTEASEGRDE